MSRGTTQSEESKLSESVFIIESEGARDLIDRRTEGEGLQRLISLCNRKSTLRKVTTREGFEQEIEIFSRSECGILHLSCHGNEDGIGFTNGDSLSWSQLFALLDTCIAGKVLFLSSCAPMGGTRLIDLFKTSGNHPFMVAGSPTSLKWREAFVVWTLLYNAFSCSDKAGSINRSLAAYHLVSNSEFEVHFWLDDDDNPGKQCCHRWTAESSLHQVLGDYASSILGDDSDDEVDPLTVAAPIQENVSDEAENDTENHLPVVVLPGAGGSTPMNNSHTSEK